MVLPRFYHRTDVNFTYVKSVACLADVCPEPESAQSVQGPMLSLNLQVLRLRVTLPGLPRWVTWLVGEVVVKRARVPKPSPFCPNVVGFFVGFGGGTVLG